MKDLIIIPSHGQKLLNWYQKYQYNTRCGLCPGFFLKLVKELSGAETWGIELLPEIAEKATVDKILTGKVEDLIHLILDGYFDCITFNDVLNIY